MCRRLFIFVSRYRYALSHERRTSMFENKSTTKDRETVRVLRPGWEPSMAFLSRTTPAKTTREAADTWAEEAEKQLNRPDRHAA